MLSGPEIYAGRGPPEDAGMKHRCGVGNWKGFGWLKVLSVPTLFGFSRVDSPVFSAIVLLKKPAISPGFLVVLFF